MADVDEPGDEHPAEKPIYDQDFFLDLAQGKEKWNEWRRAKKDIRVTFAGIDFSKSPRDKIDFSGSSSAIAWICRGASGGALKWREDTETTFEPGGARFTGAAFGDETKFTGLRR